jgi:pimeloyl-ACP methyl ester carboxylesterase
MPFVENNGVNIYYEVEGDGDSLVLQHGLTSNLKDFRRYSYTDKLGQKYQLILIDARGHGKSDKPHESDAYRLRNFVNDTVAVLDDLGIERSHFLGYSMGRSIGLGIGVYSPERFRSLIIGGMGMAETNSQKEINRRKAFIDVFREGNEATIAWFERIYGVLSPEHREDLMGNDPEALIACWSVREHVGFEDRLPLVDLPCLFYAGDQDYLHQRSKQTVEIIPGRVSSLFRD